MWWRKKKKVKEDPDTKMVDVKKLNLPGNLPFTGTVTVPATTAIPNTINSGIAYGPNLTAAAPSPVFSNVTVAAAGAINIGASAAGGQFVAGSGLGQFTFHVQQPANILTINGHNQQEIVRITKDGEVIWANGFEVNEAAEAFASSLHLSTEIAAGIRYSTKQKMRDAVFEEMISMAQEKGSLTADELTYLWQAVKIMDKLKGII
jgi:hypothetical protein